MSPVASGGSVRTGEGTTPPPAGPASTPATTPPRSPTTPPAAAAQPVAVARANETVTAALFVLVERSRALTDDKALSAARKAAAQAAASARSHLSLERKAAYGDGTRSCSLVLAHTSAVRAAAGRAGSARWSALGASTRLRAEVAQLEQATAAVTKDLALLRSAITAAGSAGSPGSTVSPADVAAALAAAAALRAATLADITSTDQKTSDAVASAVRLASSAASIAGKAC
jgi:hypothetical protein